MSAVSMLILEGGLGMGEIAKAAGHKVRTMEKTYHKAYARVRGRDSRERLPSSGTFDAAPAPRRVELMFGRPGSRASRTKDFPANRVVRETARTS
jgi:hypothetical protein